MLRDHENRIGLRLLLLPESAELAAFTEGGYDRYFEAAQDHRLPTFVYLPDHPELLRPYARRFPEVPLILDHCGLRFGGASAATYQAVIAGERPASATAPSDAFARFDDVLALAELPNVALKWAHAPRGSSGPYPYDDVLVQLERALETFGPQRIMWASDHTTSKPWHSWAEALFCIREHGGISEEDKEWILGRAARTLLRWPAP
jgi:L-fuconolactonase